MTKSSNGVVYLIAWTAFCVILVWGLAAGWRP